MPARPGLLVGIQTGKAAGRLAGQRALQEGKFHICIWMFLAPRAADLYSCYFRPSSRPTELSHAGHSMSQPHR